MNGHQLGEFETKVILLEDECERETNLVDAKMAFVLDIYHRRALFGHSCRDWSSKYFWRHVEMGSQSSGPRLNRRRWYWSCEALVSTYMGCLNTVHDQGTVHCFGSLFTFFRRLPSCICVSSGVPSYHWSVKSSSDTSLCVMWHWIQSEKGHAIKFREVCNRENGELTSPAWLSALWPPPSTPLDA